MSKGRERCTDDHTAQPLCRFFGFVQKSWYLLHTSEERCTRFMSPVKTGGSRSSLIKRTAAIKACKQSGLSRGWYLDSVDHNWMHYGMYSQRSGVQQCWSDTEGLRGLDSGTRVAWIKEKRLLLFPLLQRLSSVREWSVLVWPLCILKSLK